jgi:hypothetical protein
MDLVDSMSLLITFPSASKKRQGANSSLTEVSSLTQALALSFTTTMSIPRLAMQTARSASDGIRLISPADGQSYEQVVKWTDFVVQA